MEITLNNRIDCIEGYDSMTVSELLAYKNYTYKMLVVKINKNIIKKSDYPNAIIRSGDDVIVLHLIAGG